MSAYKINFHIEDYKAILPPIPTDERLIINSEKDSPYDQYWVKQPFPYIISHDFLMQEAHRLKNGVWMLNKGVPIWIPPNYYQFLQYGKAGGSPPQFRLKRLKNVYTKIGVRKNARFLGTYNIKNRQDGDTTFAMSDALWEVNSGELNDGMIGIQSKTREDAINPCWFNMQSNWNGYPHFFKEAFYSSFASGDSIEQKLKFMQAADPNDPNDQGKNIVIQYGPAVYNAFDGKNNMRKCILDEINKWIVCSFIDTFINYKNFIMPGKVRKGLFDIFSSPADINGRHNDEAYKFWQDSNPLELQANGSTKSRIWRMYANPLDGIEGFYDEFGDADPDEVLEHIKNERASARPDKLMGVIRGHPLPIINTDVPNEEELFGATDTQSRWSNARGIKARAVQVKSKKEELVVYGNLEWPLNTQDSGYPQFRASDLMRFDDRDARWCFATTSLPRIDLRDFQTPPDQSLIEGVIGVDPYGSVNHAKNKRRQSLGAAVDWRFKDLSRSGWLQAPTGIYLARPWHKTLFHEDMIKFCVFSRSRMQYEHSDGGALQEYFYDRGYIKWLIDSRDKAKIETPTGLMARKGDAPAGRGATAFLNEIISAIDGVTNLPYNSGDPYLLLQWMFEELLDDVDNFDKDDTVYNHLTMALGQALMGRNKLLFQKIRERDTINDSMMKYFLGR